MRTIAERNALCEQWIRLVHWFAQKVYKGSIKQAMDYEDVVSAGCLGLIEAAQRFDPSKAKFNTYAVWWIRQSIQKAFHGSRLIHVPHHYVYKKGVRRAYEEDANVALRAIKSLTPVNDDHHFDDVFVDSDEGLVSESEEVEQLRKIMRQTLSWRERVLLRLRYNESHTLDEVGVFLGISKERVRQIEVLTLKKLRMAYEGEMLLFGE